MYFQLSASVHNQNVEIPSSEVLINIFLVGMSLKILLVDQNFNTFLYHSHARGKAVFGQVDNLESCRFTPSTLTVRQNIKPGSIQTRPYPRSNSRAKQEDQKEFQHHKKSLYKTVRIPAGSVHCVRVVYDSS